MSAFDLEHILDGTIPILSDDFEERMFVLEYFLAMDLFGWSALPNDVYRDFVAMYCMMDV